MSASTLISSLRSTLSDDALIIDPDVLETYRRDQALTAPSGWPLLAVLPRNTSEVQAVMREAWRNGVPVVARGAGSGLSGGANAVDGCIVLSLMRMDRVLEVNPDDLYISLQPGVLNAEVSEAARPYGLFYPPDPASASFCSIGGNLATNAGGLCCVKYGVTRDFVLGLEVVLADGSLLRTGRKTVKGTAGFDLSGLFVGSEGTLGVITEAILRLRPAAKLATTTVAFFNDLEATGAAVASLTRAGVVPSLLEVMDQTTIRAVDDWKSMGLDRDAAALLLAQSDAGPAAPGEVELLATCCQDAGATYVAHSSDPVEAEQLLAARRFAYPALERLGTALLDDVAVPRSQVPNFLRAVGEIAQQYQLEIGTFGHIGDGNMHPTIVYDADNSAQSRAANHAFNDIVLAALELDGTVTGEHGVGILKRSLFEREAGPVSLQVHRAIKNALDPKGILNPGKAF